MAKIPVDKPAEIYDALIRGAPDTFARELGLAFDSTKIFYVTTSTTWGAVISNMLKCGLPGIPPEIARIKVRIAEVMPGGRIDVGYEGYRGCIPIEIDIGAPTFADRARVPLIDAIKATLATLPNKDLEAIAVAASLTTWSLLHSLDPRLEVTAVTCLGCRTAVVPTVPDGTFLITTAGEAGARAVTIPLS